MTRILSFLAAGALALAMSFGVYAQVGVLAPAVTLTTVTTTAVQIIGTNAARKTIQICNAGTSILWIWPGALSPAVSAYELPALSSGTTVCFTPPTGFGTQGTNSAGNSWNAQSVTTSGAASVFEW